CSQSPDQIVSWPSAVSTFASQRGKQLSIRSFTRHELGLEILISNQSRGIEETGLDIIELQPIVRIDDLLRGRSSRHHLEHVLHRQSPAADNCLATVNVRIEGDPLQQICLIGHTSNSTPAHLVAGGENPVQWIVRASSMALSLVRLSVIEA